MERRSLAKTVAGVGGTVLPPHISIMGNRFTLVDGAGVRHQLNSLSLDCVVLDINEKMSRMYYGPDNAYDPDNPAAPLCFSDNGIAPSTRSREPQAKCCKPDREGINGCRWSVWGSATSKVTGSEVPACQNGVKLAVLMVKQEKKEWLPAIADKDGYKPMVFMLRVPPASLVNVANYGKTVSGMGKLTIPWTGEELQSDLAYVVTRIEFEPQTVGKLSFRAVGYIGEEIDRLIDAVPQERVDTAVGRDDEPIGALPAPANGKQDLPKPPQRAAAIVENGLPTISDNRQQTPQPVPQASRPTPSTLVHVKRPRGRPPKNGAPAASAAPFEPRPNPNIVTSEDVRNDTKAREQQEEREAQAYNAGLKAVAAALETGNPEPAAPANQFGIVETAPEPPKEALDSFFDIKM